MRRILGRKIISRPSAICSVAAAGALDHHAIAPSLSSSCALPLATSSSSSTNFSTQSRSFVHRTCIARGSGGESDNASDPTVSGEFQEATFVSSLRHVLAELPANGLRLVDFQDRLRNILGSDAKCDPKLYGFNSLFEALLVVNDGHYMDGDIIIPCDWERVLSKVRAKLPAGGVLEPAFVRYINAEGCPRFKRGAVLASKSEDEWKNVTVDESGGGDAHSTGRELSMREQGIRQILAELKRDNPSNSSLPGVTMHEWIRTHFSKLFEIVDVTPPAVIARAKSQGVAVPQTFVYKPIEDLHPFVNVLRMAMKCIGCTNPQHMPVAVPLQDIAAIIPLLPINPKTAVSYTWPEFLQLPDVAEHFETKVSVFVAEQKLSDTQLVFVDGTSLGPDEAEAAVHQWRTRRSKEMGDMPIKVHLIVFRREEDAPHTREDVIIDGQVVEPSHALLARLALIADTGSLEADNYQNIGGHGVSFAASQARAGGIAAIPRPDGGGWSGVDDASSSASAQSAAVLANPLSSSTAIAAALTSSHHTDDVVEMSVPSDLIPKGNNGPDSAAVKADGAIGSDDGSNGASVLSTPGSLVFPKLPSNFSPDVVVLVGSREAKEAMDAELADVNAQKHWIRTMLVIGEE